MAAGLPYASSRARPVADAAWPGTAPGRSLGRGYERVSSWKQPREERPRVKIGLQIPDFTTPDGPARLGANLATVARTADDAGFDFLAVMDHFFQIQAVGPADHEMLEAYTTLGYLAASTSRARLLTLVTGVTYRNPGILAKIITTLDVLSGGRAWLGIGAAWNEEESRGLGIPFPPLAERFERLEETLQICLQMFRGDDSPYRGRHYQLERPLNSPLPLTRPHPPILIGGSGEKKTLRLVAQYAQACNLFPGPELARKLDVLRGHCEAVGRDYDEIEKTVYFLYDVGEKGEKAAQVVDQLGGLAEMGFGAAIGQVRQRLGRHPARGHRQRGHPRRRHPLTLRASAPAAAVPACSSRRRMSLGSDVMTVARVSAALTATKTIHDVRQCPNRPAAVRPGQRHSPRRGRCRSPEE